MRTIILIITVLLVSCKEPIVKQPVNEEITKDSIVDKVPLLTNVAAIKKEYTLAQSKLKNNELDSIAFTYTCEVNGTAGDVTYFSEKNTLKVIKHTYGENSHFGATETYYVANDIPYFIFIEEGYWSFDGGTPDELQTKDEITEHRIYLNNNQVIDYLEKKYTIKSNSKQNINPDNISNTKVNANATLELANYKLLFKNRNKKGNQGCLN